MHSILALLRLIHRELYELGPGVVPAVLSKFQPQWAWAILLLCCATAAGDLLRRRWLGGLLWAAAGGASFAALGAGVRLWEPAATLGAAWGAIILAVLAMCESLVRELRSSLRAARRERRDYRRIRPEALPVRRRD